MVAEDEELMLRTGVRPVESESPKLPHKIASFTRIPLAHKQASYLD